ncbi:MAG: hypothetical protein BYD32DRAFT_460577 [Podila humilis]|nr:MAG: hypothetical protein BYD32DRAFT_460577 [Podila humilis]
MTDGDETTLDLGSDQPALNAPSRDHEGQGIIERVQHRPPTGKSMTLASALGAPTTSVFVGFISRSWNRACQKSPQRSHMCAHDVQGSGSPTSISIVTPLVVVAQIQSWQKPSPQ